MNFFMQLSLNRYCLKRIVNKYAQHDVSDAFI